MTELEEKVYYVAFDGEAACLIDMLCSAVTFEVNASKLGTFPDFRDLVVFLKDLADMVSMMFIHVLNAKIIYDEAKLDGPPQVLPQTRRCSCIEVARFFEARL